MKYFAKLASGLNVDLILTEVIDNFHRFKPRPALTNYTDAVQELDAISVIGNNVNLDEENIFANTKKLVNQVVQTYLPNECRLTNLTINKLDAGKQVYPHIDTAPLSTPDYYEYNNRHHIVIKTNSGVTMTAIDETVHMKPGELWTFNNQVMHEIRNFGDDWRIHVVFDAWYKTPRYRLSETV